VIIVLRGGLKKRKELVDRFDLHYVDAMALNDDEKGLSIEFFGFYLLDDLLGMQSLSFPKKLFVDAKTVLTALYLFFRSRWQIFVLLNARSQLLEVIFLLVQTEAQYNLDTINNIITVGVVKWDSSIFFL
jgi:hypothetical protein